MNSSNKNTEKVWNLVIKTRQDIHQAYYIEILKFCETVHKKKKPELLSKNLFLHHENAPVNQALSVKSVYGKAPSNGLCKPLYSQNLAPANFWLLTKLKSTLKGQTFHDTKAIARNVITATLKVISKDEVHKCF